MLLNGETNSVFKRTVKSGEGVERKEPNESKVSKLEPCTTDRLNGQLKGTMLIFCICTKRGNNKDIFSSGGGSCPEMKDGNK